MKEHAGSRDIGFRGVAMVAGAMGAVAIQGLVIDKAELKSLKIEELTVTGALKLPEVRA
jgi:hypothetical protein